MAEFSQLLPMVWTRVANVMGYGELRVKQQEAIMEFMTGQHVFVALPQKAIRLHKSLRNSEIALSKVVVHLSNLRLWSDCSTDKHKCTICP